MVEYVAYGFAITCVLYFGLFFGLTIYYGVKSAKQEGGRWWLTG